MTAFRIPVARPWLPPVGDYVDIVERVWKSRMLSNFGPLSIEVEGVASDYLGVDHVLATASGDLGLMLVLKAFDVPAGAPCYVADFTFNSTVHAALWNGLRPVLVDVDAETYTMDPNALASAMTGQPAGVILATHTFGNPCHVEELSGIAQESGSRLVYDAAHAYGSLRDGTPVGQFGDASVYSLSGTKLVTTAEGGLVATTNTDIAERLSYLRAYGFRHDYVSRYVGLNAKISELHCALGLLTLPHVELAVADRARVVARYRELLGDNVTWQHVADGDRSTYKDVAVRTGSDAGMVQDAMRELGIEVKRYFRPLHSMELFVSYAFGDLSVADGLYSDTVCLPAFEGIGDDEIAEVAGALLRHIG